jgi:hypothetical protein
MRTFSLVSFGLFLQELPTALFLHETQHELDTFPRLLTFVRISLTVYASVPLRAVYASVPLCEQTCSKPFYASQTSIFTSSDHIDTALTRWSELLLWPDCTLSPLETLALKNRWVTQSIATQMSSQPRLLYLNRRSDPRRALLPL